MRESAPHQEPTDRGKPVARNLAGTQAQPVDTNSGSLHFEASNPQRLGSVTRKDTVAKTQKPKAALAQIVEASDLKSVPVSVQIREAAPNGSVAQKVEPFAHNKVSAGSNPAAATKFDKVAYQRAYMAKYRRGEVGNKYRQPLPKQYD